MQFEGQRGTTGQASSSRGLPLFSLPPSPILSSAFALWENAELYILVLSLTNFCPVSLPLEESCKYLSILMVGLWNSARSLPVHNHYDLGRTKKEDYVRTIFWLYKGQDLQFKKTKRGLQDKPPVPECYHYSPLPWSLYSALPLPFWQRHSSTSWSANSLSYYLCPTPGRKLEISVKIDARTLQFGMKPFCMQSLGFRKNLLWGPCEDHVWTLKGPILAI